MSPPQWVVNGGPAAVQRWVAEQVAGDARRMIENAVHIGGDGSVTVGGAMPPPANVPHGTIPVNEVPLGASLNPSVPGSAPLGFLLPPPPLSPIEDYFSGQQPQAPLIGGDASISKNSRTFGEGTREAHGEPRGEEGWRSGEGGEGQAKGRAKKAPRKGGRGKGRAKAGAAKKGAPSKGGRGKGRAKAGAAKKGAPRKSGGFGGW